jgi:hypothetical protein
VLTVAAWAVVVGLWVPGIYAWGREFRKEVKKGGRWFSIALPIVALTVCFIGLGSALAQLAHAFEAISK